MKSKAPITFPAAAAGEGTQVSVPGLPSFEGVRVDKITESCVYVSGPRIGRTTISRGTPVQVYERPATEKEPGLTVVVPAGADGAFSSLPGGKVRRGVIPGGPPPPPRKQGAVKATKGEGVCACIDSLIMEGGRTALQIAELVLARFPGRDAKATLATVKIRPNHIRKRGLVPPPFAK